MPSPVLHSFAGYSLYKYSLQEGEAKSWKKAAFYMFAANLPDLDMIPGAFLGNPEMFHRSFTHSLMGAALFAFLVSAAARLWRKQASASKVFWITFLAYASHMFLDAATGVEKYMFWPFHFIIQPLPLPVILERLQPVLPCQGFENICSLFFSSTFTVRLMTEALLVFVVSRIARLFPKYRVLQTSVADSPAFIAGLALFLFVLTAFMMTEVAG